MKRCTYHINDTEYMRRMYEDVPNIDEILSDLDPFICKYTLFIEDTNGGSHPTRFELTDADGNKLDINTLNGYQKGVVLGSCYQNFIDGTTEPFGAMQIDTFKEARHEKNTI